jgi:hypothetical protein
MSSKGNWENDEAMEELRKKNKEICRLINHNKKILDEVKRVKEEKKNYENKEETRILDEESTKKPEES